MLDNRKKLQLALAKKGILPNDELVKEIEQIYTEKQCDINGVVVNEANWCDNCQNPIRMFNNTLQLLCECESSKVELVCDCEIPKPKDAYDEPDKYYCRDCNGRIAN